MKKDQPAAPSGDQKPRFKMTRRLDSTPGGDPVVQGGVGGGVALECVEFLLCWRDGYRVSF